MFAISPTDNDWFSFLRKEKFNSEINFWTPTPWNFKALRPGEKFYFMLKAPVRKIGGYGEFVEYKNLTPEDAWNEFGFKNGCINKQELIDRLNKYKSKNSIDQTDVERSLIGCIILSNAVYWDDEEFKNPYDFNIDFPTQIVKYKRFNQEDKLSSLRFINTAKNYELVSTENKKLKKATTVTARKGQGIFHSIITKAYNNRCCITGDETPELLQAAHIQPYINENSNHVQNGLLLRIDLHKLYDNGLIYIDEKYKIRVSPHINSNDYKQFDTKSINLPFNKSEYPSIEALTSRKYEFRKE